MRITVRGRHGELQLDSLEELRQAQRRGFVRPEDWVRGAVDDTWRRVGELPAPRRSLWARLNPWTVVVTLLGAKRS